MYLSLLENIKQTIQSAYVSKKIYYPQHIGLESLTPHGTKHGHYQPIDFTKGYVISAFLDSRAKIPFIKVLYTTILFTVMPSAKEQVLL